MKVPVLWKGTQWLYKHSLDNTDPGYSFEMRFKIQCNLLLKTNKAGACPQPSYSYSALEKDNSALFDDMSHSFRLTDTSKLL